MRLSVCVFFFFIYLFFFFPLPGESVKKKKKTVIGINQLPRHLSRSVLPTSTTKAFGSSIVACDELVNVEVSASMEGLNHELQQLMILLRGDSVAVSWTAEKSFC